MRVLMVEPGKPPYETELKDGLKSMQKAVGGYIEGCYPFEDPVALICNENGKRICLGRQNGHFGRLFRASEDAFHRASTPYQSFDRQS